MAKYVVAFEEWVKAEELGMNEIAFSRLCNFCQKEKMVNDVYRFSGEPYRGPGNGESQDPENGENAADF